MLRPLCARWSGTHAHSEHTRQELICALHTSQEQVRALIVRVRNYINVCTERSSFKTCSAYPGTDAYLERTCQELMCSLNVLARN